MRGTDLAGAPTAVTFVMLPRSGVPLEIGVVADDDGTRVIDAMQSRSKFLEEWFTL